MYNKLSVSEANSHFEYDSWYQPMLYFSSYPVKNITLETVIKYLEKENLKFEIGDNNINDNIDVHISSTNSFDLKRIFKRDGTDFYTDHIYNKVRSIAYMDNPPAYTNEIIVNIEHKSGWLVDLDDWNYFLNFRNEISDEEKKLLRDNKLCDLLEKETHENMAPDFNYHLLRHMRFYLKNERNIFIESIYDFYNRKGYITKRQLEKVNKIMYYDENILY